MGNPIQHLGRPSGDVMVSCVEEATHFRFAVRDDGPGIGEIHLDRIFRIFHSMDPDRPPGEGALLGRLVLIGQGTVAARRLRAGTQQRTPWGSPAETGPCPA